MKTKKGILLIVITLAITLIVWLTATPEYPLIPLDRARHVMAGFSLSGFVLVFLLSTRNKTIIRWFNGLENVYVYHKYLAIFSVGSLIIHAILGELVTIATSGGLPTGNSSQLGAAGEVITLNSALGSAAIFLFGVLAVLALFAKSLKYETWRTTHRLMLLAYVIGLAHAYLSSKYDLLQFNALGIWMALLAITSIISGLYIIFVYQKKEFKYKGAITEIEKLGAQVIKLTITLDQPLNFSKGQFIFIKILHDEIAPEPHPFSLSGGDGKSIVITIKNSGDFTYLVHNHIEVGTKVTLAGPYGKMDFAKGRKKQLWIAGGIGITPFISYLTDENLDQTIDLYYSYQGPDAAIYRPLLEEYQSKRPNFKAHFADTSTEDRLNFDDYPLEDGTSIFMCGPTPMMENFSKVFKAKQKDIELIYEGFKFR